MDRWLTRIEFFFAKLTVVAQDAKFSPFSPDVARSILLAAPQSARTQRAAPTYQSPLKTARELRLAERDDSGLMPKQPPSHSGDVALGLLLPRPAFSQKRRRDTSRPSSGRRITPLPLQRHGMHGLRDHAPPAIVNPASRPPANDFLYGPSLSYSTPRVSAPSSKDWALSPTSSGTHTVIPLHRRCLHWLICLT